LHGSSCGIMLAAVSGTLIDEGVSVGCNEDPVVVNRTGREFKQTY